MVQSIDSAMAEALDHLNRIANHVSATRQWHKSTHSSLENTDRSSFGSMVSTSRQMILESSVS